MEHEKAQELVPREVTDLLRDRVAQLLISDEWKSFEVACAQLKEHGEKYKERTIDPRFNAVWWAKGVEKLCREIGFAYCWLRAFKEYGDLHSESTAVCSFNIVYHADNAFTRICACRDKIALMILSYYIPFYPESIAERVPDFKQIRHAFRNPQKLETLTDKFERLKKIAKAHGHNPWRVPAQTPFEDAFSSLSNPNFDKAIGYRHSKIHRTEPGIILDGDKSDYGWYYIVPVDDVAVWRSKMQKLYGVGQCIEPELFEKYSIDQSTGILYDQIHPQEYQWTYDEASRCIKECLDRLLSTCRNCLDVLIETKYLFEVPE